MKRFLGAIVALLLSLSLCAQASAAFVYTDAETGLSFTVPDNWEQEESVSEGDFMDAGFVPTDSTGYFISYGREDMWEKFTFLQKAASDRKDLDMSDLTEEDRIKVAEVLGISEDEIDVVTYNKQKYYRVEIKTTEADYGVSATITQLLHIENGWIYSFLFVGAEKDKYYADFEKLVKSVQYPIPKLSEKAVAEGKITLILFLVALFAAISVFFVCKKRKAKKYEPVQRENEWVTCRSCGEILPKDSKFCYKCGERI